jgi:RNA polymerase sigma-B factor
MSTQSLDTQVDDQMMLGEAMPQLRDLEKQVLTLFFFDEQSKTEIARRLNISVNYVAYLVKKGIDHLRQIIESGETLPARTWSQQEARASYLLALARAAANGDTATVSAAAPLTEAAVTSTRASAERKTPGRRERRKPARVKAVPGVTRSGVSSFDQFAGWLDEEIHRANRYNQEFGLLWLGIDNWEEVTARLEEAQRKRALVKTRALTRKCCRTADRVALMPTEAVSGLHFLVLMPHTGETGKRVAERWLKNCMAQGIFPDDPSLVSEPIRSHAMAIFPRHGKSAEDLLGTLGDRIKEHANGAAPH